MSNHCLDATCVECGAQRCIRGCGFQTDPEAAEADRAKQSESPPVAGVSCQLCGGDMVVL